MICEVVTPKLADGYNLDYDVNSQKPGVFKESGIYVGLLTNNRQNIGTDSIQYYDRNKLSTPISNEEEIPSNEELLDCYIYSGMSLEDSLISIGL
jgi:hypothetical protein